MANGKAHALHRSSRGNGTYKPTLGDLHQQITSHEADDKAMHKETNESIQKLTDTVGKFADNVQELLTDRTVREAVEKKTRTIYVGLITVAGIVIPLAVAVFDHLSK